ncbi:hypothetical protein GGR50DRAFT_494128 [Xylaria sp. CBS 124048]|nr:hypothetical protein GGR50DRAFT_494128 [Xylaria sp. CBS 124048]
MLPSGFGARSLCLRAILMTGWFLGSLCENAPRGETTSALLVIGTPAPTTSVTISTFTVTTTIAYKPSLIPGDSQYTLVGCYSQATGIEGRVFGPDGHNAYPKGSPKNITIRHCLGACGSAPPPINTTAHFLYAGMRNGSECICGTHFLKDARKLLASDCQLPCPGDQKQACGGRGNMAVYKLISPGPTDKPMSQTRSEDHSSSSIHANATTSPTIIATSEPTITSGPSPVGTNAQEIIPEATSPEEIFPEETIPRETMPQAAASGAMLPPSHARETRKKVVSAPTIAAITSTLSVAFIISVALVLCYRVRKRKQLHDAKTALGSRSAPVTPILTRGDINIPNVSYPNIKHEDYSKHSSNVGIITDVNAAKTIDDIPPATPVLDPNETYPGAQQAHTTAAGRVARTGKLNESDSLYGSLMEEVRAGPVDTPLDAGAGAGASSSVRWRPSDTHHSSASVSSTSHIALHRKTSLTNIARPPPVADVKPLGERAWHRRKLSTPYPPPLGLRTGSPAAGPERGSNVPLRGPAGSPPAERLPPTPRLNFEVWEGSLQQLQSKFQFDGREEITIGMRNPPIRPRRSLDVIGAFELESTHYTVPDIVSPGTLEGGLGVGNKRTILGMSHLNVSTPSLGRYGSISRSRRSGTETLVESPILGWLSGSSGRRPNGAPWRQAGGPAIPVLPPVAPGERFDHKRWKDTLHAEFPRGSEDWWREKERERQQQGGDLSSPISLSSIGTSMLFTPREFDRQI